MSTWEQRNSPGENGTVGGVTGSRRCSKHSTDRPRAAVPMLARAIGHQLMVSVTRFVAKGLLTTRRLSREMSRSAVLGLSGGRCGAVVMPQTLEEVSGAASGRPTPPRPHSWGKLRTAETSRQHRGRTLVPAASAGRRPRPRLFRPGNRSALSKSANPRGAQPAPGRRGDIPVLGRRRRNASFRCPAGGAFAPPSAGAGWASACSCGGCAFCLNDPTAPGRHLDLLQGNSP